MKSKFLSCGIKKHGVLFVPPKSIHPFGYPIAVESPLIERNGYLYAKVVFRKYDEESLHYININDFKVNDPLYPILGQETKKLSPYGIGPDEVYSINRNNEVSPINYLDRGEIISKFPQARELYTHIDYLEQAVKRKDQLIHEKEIQIKELQMKFQLTQIKSGEESKDANMWDLERTSAAISRLKSSGLLLPQTEE